MVLSSRSWIVLLLAAVIGAAKLSKLRSISICAGDMITYCANVVPGDEAMEGCLLKHRTRISDSCLNKKPLPRRRHEQACRLEIATLCATVESDRTRVCLRHNWFATIGSPHRAQGQSQRRLPRRDKR